MSTEQLQQPPAMEAATGSSDLMNAAKDVLSSIVGSAMCVYTGQPFDTGAWACHCDCDGGRWRWP